MEKNDWKKKVLSRKGISLISQIAIVVLIFGIYLLGDYLSFKGSMEFASSPEYWITTAISITLIDIMYIIIFRPIYK